MASTEILCLANSKKYGGRCLAGLRWPDLQAWIRPVDPTREHGEVPSNRAQVNSPEGRRFIRPLDVINVDLIEAAPKPAQPENWILGSSPITLVQTLDIAEVASRLRSAADTATSVFDLDGGREVPRSVWERGLTKSIALYEVQEPLFKRFERDDSSAWKVKFQYGSCLNRYFPVSDDLGVSKRLHRSSKSAVRGSGRWFLTISLTEPFLDAHSRWLTVAVAIQSEPEMPPPTPEEEPF